MPYSANLVLDVIKRDPGTTSHVLQGIYFGRIAPPREERMDIEAPALVIGHKFDPVHPFQDAVELAKDMPNATFIEARSIAELRLMPKRLTQAIIEHVDLCWQPRAVAAKRPAARRTTTRGAVKRGQEVPEVAPRRLRPHDRLRDAGASHAWLKCSSWSASSRDATYRAGLLLHARRSAAVGRIRPIRACRCA